MSELTVERLKELLEYDPKTGIFVWKKRYKRKEDFSSVKAWANYVKFRNNCEGKIAGSYCEKGYLRIRINDVLYKGHTLAWFYIYGEWIDLIDHADCDPSNNRITNLRKATPAQNSQNMKLNSRNKSGYKGVSWNSRDKRWVAHGSCNGVRKNIGSFLTPEEASEAYNNWSKERHGEFFNNGQQERVCI